MVVVTELAKEALLQLRLRADIDQPEVGLRLAADPEGEWKLFPDRTKAGDQIVEHGGSRVLLIDRETSQILEGTRVDCKEAAKGTIELVITRSESGNGRAT